MSTVDEHGLSGVQKAAILLMFLRKDLAAQLLRMLTKEEVQSVGIAMAELDRPSKEKIESVVRAFIEDLHGTALFQHTGPDYVQSVLPDLLDDDRRNEIMPLIQRRVNKDFEIFVANRQPGAVAALLKEEQPQVQAVALALMGPINAAKVLRFMDQHRQAEVTMRMSRLKQIPGDLADDVMFAIRDALGAVDDYVDLGGLDKTARILGKMREGDRGPILGAVEDEDPDLAEALQKRMVRIEDLSNVSTRVLKDIFQDVGTETVITAMRGCPPDLIEHFMGCFSSRKQDEIREDLEDPSRTSRAEIEKAKEQIVAEIMKLATQEYVEGLGFGIEEE